MSLRNEGVAPTTVTTLVDLNTVGDTAVHVPFAKYIIRRMTAFDVSTTLAASSATLGAYTGAAAGGNLISTPATKVGLTAAAKFLDCTIASPSTTDYQTASTIYIRVGVANGAAATCSVAFELECLE